MGLHHGLCHLNLGGAVARGHISLVKMVVTLSIRHKGETQSGTTYNELNQSNLATHEQGETREDAVGTPGPVCQKKTPSSLFQILAPRRVCGLESRTFGNTLVGLNGGILEKMGINSLHFYYGLIFKI